VTPERYESVQEIFLSACDCKPQERCDLLDQACGGDVGLRAEVERLLAADDDVEGILTAAGIPVASSGSSAPCAAVDIREPDAAVAALPDRIGKYAILGILGEGGMGVVYRAEQDHPRREVALKVIRPGFTSKHLRRRFEHEAQLLGRLQHPGIAQIFEAGMADTGHGLQPFFAMEAVYGQCLTDYVKSEDLDVRERLELFARICDAVQHAHQKGIIHRDLKPGNILITREGDPKILDFGVARATDSDIQTTTLHTHVGQLIGTLAYMSPEQARGDSASLDTRSDIYALGVLCYELLAGRLPYDFTRKSVPESLRVIGEERPTSLSLISRVFRGELGTITTTALEKDPDRRYQTAWALADDVRRYLNKEPIRARPPSATYQFRKLVSRHKLPASLMAALFLAVAGFGVWMSVLYRHSDRLRAAAERKSAESQQVQAFLQDVIAGARPESGRELTMKEALDRAAGRVEAELSDHPEVEAAVRMAIGTAYRSLVRNEIAERHLRRALELRQQLWGTDNELVAESMRLLGIALRSQDKYDEALEMFEQALAIKERLLGENHHQVALALNSLALTLRRVGRIAEAEECLRRAVAIDRQTPGRDVTLAIHLTNLAPVIQDDPEAKEAALLEALEILRPLAPPTALPATLSVLTSLTRSQGRLAEAEDYARECLQAANRAYAGDDPRVARALLGLACVLVSAGRFSEAEPLLDDALAIYRQHWGDDHLTVANTLTCLAELEAGRGEDVAALAHVEDAARIFRQIPPQIHLNTDSYMATLGTLLVSLGRPAEAQLVLQECLERCHLRSPPNVRQIARAESALGEALTALGQYEAAEAVLLGSYREQSESSVDVSVVRATLERIVHLYEAWGKPDQVAEWRAKLPATQLRDELADHAANREAP
jgi:serine/threonine protein kinase/Tfp pilus assembly protein PilF